MEELKKGDIYYAKLKWSGCSYHYVFAIVEKKLESKKFGIRYRFRPVGTHNCIDRLHHDGTLIKSGESTAQFYTKVEPDTKRKAGTYLVTPEKDKNGWYLRSKYNTITDIYFYKYDPDTPLYNFSDLGD